MQIETVKVGNLQTNCYIITKQGKSVIIDPGDEYSKIINKVKDKNVVDILVTHHHFDHIGALEKLEKHFSLKHNQKMSETLNYQIIKNPGHSKDSISFYFPEEKVLFGGDFIFYHSVGRWDLPSGSLKEMKESIEKILKFPKDITIYPGHGPQTNLENEIPYLEYFMKKISFR